MSLGQILLFVKKSIGSQPTFPRRRRIGPTKKVVIFHEKLVFIQISIHKKKNIFYKMKLQVWQFQVITSDDVGFRQVFVHKKEEYVMKYYFHVDVRLS